MGELSSLLWKDEDIILLIDDKGCLNPTDLLDKTVLYLIEKCSPHQLSLSCAALNVADQNRPVEMIFPSYLRQAHLEKIDPACRLSVLISDLAAWRLATHLIEISKAVVALKSHLLEDLVLFHTFHLIYDRTITQPNLHPISTSTSKVILILKSDLRRTIFSKDMIHSFSYTTMDEKMSIIGESVDTMREVNQLRTVCRILFGCTNLRAVRCITLKTDNTFNSRTIISADSPRDIVHSPLLDNCRYKTVVRFQFFVKSLLDEWKKSCFSNNFVHFRDYNPTKYSLCPFLVSNSLISLNTELMFYRTECHPPKNVTHNCLLLSGNEIVSPHCRIFTTHYENYLLIIEPYGHVEVNYSVIDITTRLYKGDIVCIGFTHYFVVCYEDEPLISVENARGSTLDYFLKGSYGQMVEKLTETYKTCVLQVVNKDSTVSDPQNIKFNDCNKRLFENNLLRMMIAIKRINLILETDAFSVSFVSAIPFMGWIPSSAFPLKIIATSLQKTLDYSELYQLISLQPNEDNIWRLSERCGQKKRILGTSVLHVDILLQSGTFTAEVIGEKSEIVGECHLGIKLVEDEIDDFDCYIGSAMIIKSLKYVSAMSDLYDSYSVDIFVLDQFKGCCFNKFRTLEQTVQFEIDKKYKLPVNRNSTALFVQLSAARKAREYEEMEIVMIDPVSSLTKCLSSFQVVVEIFQQDKDSGFAPVPVVNNGDSGGIFQLVQGPPKRLRVRAHELPIGGVPVDSVKVTSVHVGSVRLCTLGHSTFNMQRTNSHVGHNCENAGYIDSSDDQNSDFSQKINSKIEEWSFLFATVKKLTHLKKYLTENDFSEALRKKYSHMFHVGFQSDHKMFFSSSSRPRDSTNIEPADDSITYFMDSPLLNFITDSSSCVSFPLLVQLQVTVKRNIFLLRLKKHVSVQISSSLPLLKIKLSHTALKSSQICHLVTDIVLPLDSIPLRDIDKYFHAYVESVQCQMQFYQRNKQYQALQSVTERPRALSEARNAVVDKFEKITNPTKSPGFFSATKKFSAKINNFFVNSQSESFISETSKKSFKSKVESVFKPSVAFPICGASDEALDVTVNPYPTIMKTDSLASKSISTESGELTLTDENPAIFESAPVWENDSNGDEQDPLEDLDILGDDFSDVYEDVADEEMNDTNLPEWLTNGRTIKLKNLGRLSGEIGVVRYVGKTHNYDSVIVGVELENPLGDCNGTCDGIVYFKCRNNCGIFVYPCNCCSFT